MVGNCARLTGLSPRKTFWSRSIVSTRRCWVISLTLRVFGTETSIPDCSTGAVTMKMIRSTSTTSTSGVMLISASEVRVCPLLAVKATRGLPLHRFLFGGDFFQAIEQFAGEVVHAGAKLAKGSGELVVRNDGWDGDQQAGSGGDQSFRNTRRHGTERGCAFRAQAVEGIHNTHHGAEEADKGRDCADGGQPGQAALENGEGLAGRGLCGSLQGDDVLGWSESAGLATVSVVDLVEDCYQRAGLELIAYCGHFLQAVGLAESAHESPALRARPAEGGRLTENDGPGVEAGDEQQDQYRDGNGSAVAHHVYDGAEPGQWGVGDGHCCVVCLEDKKSRDMKGGHHHFLFHGSRVGEAKPSCRIRCRRRVTRAITLTLGLRAGRNENSGAPNSRFSGREKNRLCQFIVGVSGTMDYGR